MKNDSVGFSFFHQNFGRFRSVLKTKPKKNETETARFSVGFSVGFSVTPAKSQHFKGFSVHVKVSHVTTGSNGVKSRPNPI